MIGKARELFPSEDITLADLVDDPNVTKSGSDKTHESVSFSFDEMRKGWQLLTVVSDIGEGGKQTMNRDLSPAKAFVYSFVRVSVSQFPRTGKAERTSLIVNERRGALDTHGPEAPALAPPVRLAQRTGSCTPARCWQNPFQARLKTNQSPLPPEQSFPTPSYQGQLWRPMGHLNSPRTARRSITAPLLVCRCDGQLWRKLDSGWIVAMRLMRSSYQS